MARSKRGKIIELGLLVLALTLVLLVKLIPDGTASAGENAQVGSQGSEQKNGQTVQGQDTEGAEGKESAAQTEIIVHVDGAVAVPGVYHLPADSRLADAVEKAGGLTETADTKALNLASKIHDTQKIYIYAVDELQEEGYVERAVGHWTLDDLNRARTEELTRISGVGEVMAEKIVQYREENGPFQSLGELRSVKGIGEKTLDTISQAFEISD